MAIVPFRSKILKASTVMGEVERVRKNSYAKIILTCGTFDILHAGHIGFLEAASRLGDHLFIGVNSDDYIRKTRGSDRPICSINDRLEMLAALSFTARVFEFFEDTPIEMIKGIVPDVFVKGMERANTPLPEAEICTALDIPIVFCGPIKTNSTTDVIRKISETAVRHYQTMQAAIPKVGP